MGKIEELRILFATDLLPLCEDFIMSVPNDKGRRVDTHRRISETVLQQVLLKLDAVDPDGDAVVRARRKELVRYVQAVLKRLDEALSEHP